jgi:nifR3 family TIM-barrel protein
MVIQLVGRDSEWIAKGAALAEQAGADIVDINMGCPAKEVAGALSGSALMRDLDHAERLIAAAVDAVACPVTVKMRLGWDGLTAPELARRAQAAGAAAVTVHGRTRQQFYNGRADWRAVAQVKQAVRIPVIVNGDVACEPSARAALAQSGADAVMIGRGAYGRPWIGRTWNEPALAERLAVALDHFADTLAFYGDALGLKVFRKHLGWYVERVAGREAKSRLCRLTSPREVEQALIELFGQPFGQPFGLRQAA